MYPRSDSKGMMAICGYFRFSSSGSRPAFMADTISAPSVGSPLTRQAPSSCVEARLIAQKPHAEAHGEMLALGFGLRDPFVEDLARGVVPGPRQLEGTGPVVDDLHRHLVFRQGPRLVGADHRCAPQRLDGGQFPQDRVSRRHALHPDGQRDGQHDGQALGDGGHGGGHDGHEHLLDRLPDGDPDGEEDRRSPPARTDRSGWKNGQIFPAAAPGPPRLPGSRGRCRPAPSSRPSRRRRPCHVRSRRRSP